MRPLKPWRPNKPGVKSSADKKTEETNRKWAELLTKLRREKMSVVGGWMIGEVIVPTEDGKQLTMVKSHGVEREV